MTVVGVYVVTILEHCVGLCRGPPILFYDVPRMRIGFSSLHRAFRKITSTINQQMHLYNFHLKHLELLRHVSIFSDHHQGVSSFLAKVITYSRFSSFL